MRKFKYLLIAWIVFITFQTHAQQMPFGGTFTPQGEMHVLVVYAGFSNDNVPGSPNYIDLEGHWNATDDFPDYKDELFYDELSDFDPNNTDKSLSNYFYQMSKHSPNPLKIVAHYYDERIDVPATNTGNSAGWGHYFNLVYSQINNNYPLYEYTDLKLDKRKNQPNYNFDNTPEVSDGKIDFTIVVFRWNGNDHLPYGTTIPFSNDWGQASLFSAGKVTSFVSGQPEDFELTTGFSIARGMTGVNGARDFFLHENAHRMTNVPHMWGTNGTMGNKFDVTNGWGMMGRNKIMNCANAFERWEAGWIDVKHELKGTNAVNGIYYLDDYMTSGDAIRIEVPNTNGTQHLWLENHQGKNIFDQRDAWNLTTAITTNPTPDAPRGLMMFVEGLNSDLTNVQWGRNWDYQASNGFRTICASGNYDYSYGNNFTTPWEIGGNPVFNFHLEEANPLSGYSDLNEIRLDFTGTNLKPDPNKTRIQDGQITTRHNHGNELGCTVCQSENAINAMRDGVLSYPFLGTNAGFKQGDKIDLGSNPVITNTPYYYTTSDQLTPTYLNGISIEVLSVDATTGKMALSIKFNDNELRNDTRYTGNIAVKDVPNTLNGIDFNVMPNVTLRIDKSGTPNKQYENSTGSGDFVNPTTFVVDQYALFHMESNSKVIVENGSSMIINSEGIVEVHDGAELIIKDGSKLILENLSQLMVHGGGLVKIESGGQLILKNTDTFYGLKIGDNTYPATTAELRVEGLLVVDDNAVLSMKGYGFISFYDQGNMEFGSNASIDLEGKNNQDEVIHLGTNNILNLDATTAVLKNLKIGMESDAHIQINRQAKDLGVHGVYELDNVSVIGSDFNHQTDNRVNLLETGNFTVKNSFFSAMNIGLNANNLNGVLKIENSLFQRNMTGVSANGTGTYEITTSEFRDNSKGIVVEDISQIDIEGSHIHLNDIGIDARNTNYVYVSDNSNVENNLTYGINTYKGHIFLRGESKVQNNPVGIRAFGQQFNSVMISMGDDGSCGWLVNNTTGITGKEIYLNIDAEVHAANNSLPAPIPNHFEDNGTIFDFSIYALSIKPTILAKGNFWGTVSPDPDVVLPPFGGNGLSPQGRNPLPLINILYFNGVNYTPAQFDWFNACPATLSSSCTSCPQFKTQGPSNPGPKAPMCFDRDVISNNNSIEEEFARGYQPFVQKDYVQSLPILENVANVEFRLKNPRLESNCEHLIRVAEILTEKFKNGTPGGGVLNPYKLDVKPNPVHGNFVAEYDLVDKSNGKLVIKDAITGMVMKTEMIDATQNAKQINVSTLQNGNYILEMQSDQGQFLNSEHLMVY